MHHGHAAAMACGVTAVIAVHAGQLDRAIADVRTAHPLAVTTQDMPVVATTGVAVAWVAAAMGKPEAAAKAIGAAARLRGSDDSGDPIVARLTIRLRDELGNDFDRCHREGKKLDRADAILAIDPDRILVVEPDRSS